MLKSMLVAAIVGGVATAAIAASPAEQAIRDRADHWNALLAAHDVAGIVGMYAPGATLMPPNSPAAQGPAIKAIWTGLMAAPGVKLVLKTEQVTASGDLAAERGSYVLNITGAPEDHGKYVVVWKKDGGTWKAFHDIFNSDLAPAKPGG
jgi:ketosteroid isomerase-like protein